MGAFSFRFVAICLASLVLTVSLASVASAQQPVVTVNPGGTANGSGTSSVCDPAIRSMLSAAGSAQAQRDIQTISSVIQRPANAMEINCYCQTEYNLTGQTSSACPTPPSSTTPCDSMNTAWQEAIQNANTAAQASSGGTTTGAVTFDRINLYAGATEPVSQVASNECHPGIPTGVKINGKAEIVCPNPGCAPKLDGNGYKCEKY